MEKISHGRVLQSRTKTNMGFSNDIRDRTLAEIQHQVHQAVRHIDLAIYKDGGRNYLGNYRVILFVSSSWAVDFKMMTDLTDIHFEVLAGIYETRGYKCEMIWRRMKQRKFCTSDYCMIMHRI